jgi:hypothetical protein
MYSERACARALRSENKREKYKLNERRPKTHMERHGRVALRSALDKRIKTWCETN